MKSIQAGSVSVSVVDDRENKILLRISSGKSDEALDIAFDGRRFFVSSMAGVWPCPGDLPETKQAPHHGHESPMHTRRAIPIHYIPDIAAVEQEAIEDECKYPQECLELLRRLAKWHAREPIQVRAVLYKIYAPKWGCRRVARCTGFSKTQLNALYAQIFSTSPSIARLMGLRKKPSTRKQ
jgi:hypothetical protein